MWWCVGVRAPSPALMMSDGQREILECLAGSGTAAHRDMIRAKALLLAADGLASTAIAGRLEVSPPPLPLLLHPDLKLMAQPGRAM